MRKNSFKVFPSPNHILFLCSQTACILPLFASSRATSNMGKLLTPARRGKNDPTERRRIQNRLNQRAFRQRQRSTESPEQCKQPSPPSDSSSSSSDDEEEDNDEDEADEPVATRQTSQPARSRQQQSEGRPAPSHAIEPSGSRIEPPLGRGWDELAQLINRNFLTAAVSNARQLGIDLVALRDGTLTYTPRPTNSTLPSSLLPVQLQLQIAHDPIIDILPHVRLRYNILYAIATQQLDAAAFARYLRSSGCAHEVQGSYQRGGVVVWSSPELIASWELTEGFVRRYASLLQGCEDLIAATNAWRSRRGERAFALAP